VRLHGEGPRPHYADVLLEDCGAKTRISATPSGRHPDIEWANSGAMALTGESTGPPRLAPGPFASCMREALNALRSLRPEAAALRAIDAAALLSERAALAGLSRGGRTSPGGSCRLLPSRDGFVAVNLAREDDRELLQAWLEIEPEAGESHWALTRRALAARDCRPVVERAHSMGLPVADSRPPSGPPPAWLHRQRLAPPVDPERAARPLVLDLSSLWAGPLCTHLLERSGAEVIKLESTARPDGARAGDSRFFDLLNAGKKMCAVDLRQPTGLRILRALIDRADIVVESARPRALGQLGIDAAACVAARPGLSWISITGYGREAPMGDRVAFGDDAAVAAGVAALTGCDSERPIFCGDALADPLTGAHAAVAALASYRAGGGELLDVALTRVTGHALAFRDPAGPCGQARVIQSDDPAARWQVWVDGVQDGEAEPEEVALPRERAPMARAGALGADTAQILQRHGVPH